MSLNGVRRCEVCGAVETEEVRLCIHHKDGNRLNDSPDNLMVVCLSCHGKIHIKNNPMVHGKMNFGERVKAGLVSKVYGSKVCPKCGQLGYGVVKQKALSNPRRVMLKFIHVYMDLDGVKRATACYLGSKGKKIVIKGCRVVERWTCSCGYRTDSKWRLILHVMKKHGLKVYEDIRRFILENCKHKVKWVKREKS